MAYIGTTAKTIFGKLYTILNYGDGYDYVVGSSAFSPYPASALLGINLGAGDDVLRMSARANAVYDGGGGENILDVQSVNTDTIIDLRLSVEGWGTVTSDTFTAYVANFRHVYAGNGNNTIIGDDLGNQLLSGDGNDRIYGNGGNDALIGRAGNDYLDGGSGDDAMAGELGDDTIYGGAGNDMLLGGYQNGQTGVTPDLLGRDELHGQDGDDALWGGDDLASDKLYGDNGQDLLSLGHGDMGWGGAGADMFLVDLKSFDHLQQGQALQFSILDFEHGIDKITVDQGFHLGGIYANTIELVSDVPGRRILIATTSYNLTAGDLVYAPPA